jgi:D-ribose pyranose/furanose isomerase RbsD
MMFDISLISRVSDEIESSAKRLKQHVNSPVELTNEIQKIEASLLSLKSLNQQTQVAGSNARTSQLAPYQNQS